MRFLQLGASLYVPATRPDLTAIANLQKVPGLRSVIFCTEDAIREADVPQALANLAQTLRVLEPVPLLRFVRPRNPAVLRSLLQMTGVENLSGFVFPKLTCRNLNEYFGQLDARAAFAVMPILETAEVFDAAEMIALRSDLLREEYRRRILSLRIGGNDLLHLLGLRRPRRQTLYTTPLRGVIDQLVMLFRPHGFNLTGPVFDLLADAKTLRRETRADLAHGLFGKAAIHPAQVPLIEAQYRVTAAELQMAERILEQSAPPVFRCQGALCEPATDRFWADLICRRAGIYGVRAERPAPGNDKVPRWQGNGHPQQKGTV